MRKRRHHALEFGEPTERTTVLQGDTYREWRAGDYRITRFTGPTHLSVYVCWIFEALQDDDEDSATLGDYRPIGEARSFEAATARCRSYAENHALQGA